LHARAASRLQTYQCVDVTVLRLRLLRGSAAAEAGRAA
jgi:hypothetical protein